MDESHCHRKNVSGNTNELLVARCTVDIRSIEKRNLMLFIFVILVAGVSRQTHYVF